MARERGEMGLLVESAGVLGDDEKALSLSYHFGHRGSLLEEAALKRSFEEPGRFPA